MILNKTKIHKSPNLIINILLLLAAYFFIYYQLVINNDIIIEYTRLKHNITNTNNYLLIIITIILMPVNLMIEAYKWRYLVRKTEIITFVAAIKGVLTGITTSIFTPNRIGDFIGKAFMLKKNKPLESDLDFSLGKHEPTIDHLHYRVVIISDDSLYLFQKL